jgi:hypothetical protein
MQKSEDTLAIHAGCAFVAFSFTIVIGLLLGWGIFGWGVIVFVVSLPLLLVRAVPPPIRAGAGGALLAVFALVLLAYLLS